jgi:predicted lipoprotein
MKKFRTCFFAVSILMSGLFSSCGDKDGDDDRDNKGIVDINNPEIEALATTSKWNNYLVAATDELYRDCLKLWAAWAGPSALTEAEKSIVGTHFWSTNELNAPNGYAAVVKNPGAGKPYTSPSDAIEKTIIQGSIDIAGEVGGQKIGGPYGFAIGGDYVSAVLEVESWYSWNSITDYSDNIVSIRHAYSGVGGAPSLSAFVAQKNAALDTRIKAAIDAAYNGIATMDRPFRNNLTGAKVEAAMRACADLATIYEQELNPLVHEHASYDFSSILTAYADSVVVKTYKNMKEKAEALKNAAKTYADNPTNQTLSAACAAWKATRVPWEQSEAFLFGPADVLGLDPSLDSWPLDQADILSILKDNRLQSVNDIRGAITGESVRGFHTIELLLFNNGQDRTLK